MATEPDLDDHLHTFSRICYSSWYTRIRTRILRPERPEYSMIMERQGDKATAKRQKVVRLLYNSLAGGTSCRSLLPLAQNKRIIIGLTAILFDQESSSSANGLRGSTPTMDPGPWSSFIAPPLSFLSWSGQSGARMVASLIEHMLLIDYGLGEHPLRPLGPEPRWMTNYMTRVVCHEFCRRLTKLADDCRGGKDIWHCRLAWMDEFIQSYEDKSSAYDDFSDVSLMFYLFWTHRGDIDKDKYNKGLTGYDGVLDEMISEIPTMGTDRLTRKLSVDVNKLIPRYVKDKESRAEMIAVAKRIAVEYGVVLRAPDFAFEYLERPTGHDNGSLLREITTGHGLVRAHDTASIERDVTPPPSYTEAMSLC
ncbi:hypothetical protein INS49_004592 [Diaporthe citri]|uniref:uncharacterized protein n=1 Tax=Diaporthe citri TaxID=83186 RepID=UPI001C7FD8D6|nr:uncharacterized protein INS49_004592 [Diaporthe citri]KAG6354574.1 hypothetical protein INS49_004592 [Diaporthe citri]